MEVIGRTEEVKILERLLEKNRPEFMAVYGRRRIGKTYLIRETYGKNIVFNCAGLHKKALPQQLENFVISLAEVDNQLTKITAPTSWLQAFALLKNYINNIKGTRKKVIFLDEVPWFETPKSGFLAALDNFWNQYCSKREDIILVICGSAASWIIGKIINNRGGLHNRVTTHLQLSAFTLEETRSYLKHLGVKLSLIDTIELYMCTGGIPYYLKDIEPAKSVEQIIDQLFFKAKPTLKNEFQNLYAALFKNYQVHEKIVKILAAKAKGLTRSEIVNLAKVNSGGSLSTTLQELIECGFVYKIMPINKTTEDSLYKLVDEYTIFYFKFIEKLTAKTSWQVMGKTQEYKIWCGFAFENFCLKHIENIKKVLGINGILTNEYSWISTGTLKAKGAQIDLIIDRNDNCINLLEIKFYKVPFVMTNEQAMQLLHKKNLFENNTKTKKNVFLTMLTTNGVERNEHFLSCVDGDITISECFK